MRRFVFASCVALLAAACGTVTGLSDDFDFVDDAGADGSSSGDGGRDASGDAGGGRDSGGQTCSSGQSMQASTDIMNASGDKLPNGCANCLVSSCCPDVLACSDNGTCRSTMSCVFNCESRGSTQERQQCVSQCSNLGSLQGVLGCASNDCKMTCGQFTP